MSDDSPCPPDDSARLEARLAAILDVALDCIVTVDHEGRFIDFNPAAERTFGYARAEAVGREMTDLIVPPALRAGHRAGMARMLAGAPPKMLGRRIEITALRRDGTEFPVELAITRLALDGPPVFTAHLRDITERRRTEAELRELSQQLEQRIAERTAELAGANRALEASLARQRAVQDQFEKSFHASPALMSIARLADGRLIEVNAAFARATGRGKSDLLGRSTLELGLWVDLGARDRFLKKFAAGRTVRDFEADFRTAGGATRTLLLNADTIELEGQPCILTVAVDVTERRLRAVAEAALARAEARYQGIFENSPEGLYVTSPEGKFLSVNPALARMLGYDSPAELITAVNDIGRQLYVRAGRRAEFFRLVQGSDEVSDFESELYRRDGATFWVSESVRVVRDAAGAIDRFEGVAIDITQQREAARALELAKDAADAASRAKSHFLASVSHELRTPLNGILGYTQILRRDEHLTDKQREGLRVIHESAEHLLLLINDVLDLSKIEAGRIELHAADFSLAEFAAGVERAFAPRAAEKSLLFEATLAPGLPEFVRGDEARLRQIVFNLLANAVKFTARGGVVFAIERGDGERLRFTVSDTGRGIAASDLGKIFEPFTQVGESTGAATGTGLGLAISRSLVERMGGEFRVESRLGEGSRFQFDVDLPAAAGAAPRAVAERRVLGYAGPRRRILVVDDHAPNRAVLAEMLAPLGFDIVEAADGAAAIALTASAHPDLVLMDLRLPGGIDGLEATRRIRAAAGGDTRRVIAVSASAYDIDRAECRAAGCDDFLAKPFREEELWTAVGRALGLAWRFAEEPGETRTPFAVAAEAPPPAELDALHALASAGDVVGLRARLEALAAADPALAPFAGGLLELAARFKMKAIRQTLERHRQTP